MTISLINTVEGFVPASEEDFDIKRYLKLGVCYVASIHENRNIKFHRLYFALIRCAWDHLGEAKQEFYHDNIDVFRKSVEIAAGHCELVYSVTKNEWIETPKSVAFDKMKEKDFQELYERAKDVLYQVFVPEKYRDKFEKKLRYY